MNLTTIFQNFSKKTYWQVCVVLFFVIFFVIGLSIFKDYGLSVDEPFQRTIGYYWYINLLEIFSNNYENITSIKEKYKLMYWSKFVQDGNLIQYGILFDTLCALIEENLNIQESHNAFYLKHFLTFFFFFISAIFFYKLIVQRFENNFFSLFISLFYVTSPRIFAESFYNCKDIVFMSFCVYALFFCLKCLENFNYKNILFFSIFAAFATNIRIMGILLFILFLIFLIFNCLEEKQFFKKNIYKFLILLFAYPLTVYLFWPFLWDAPISNFIFTIKSFTNYNWQNEVFYLGNFFKGSNLPWHYIPVWIIATTPIFFSIIFLLGFVKTGILLFSNFIKLSKENKLWNNLNEKKDFFMFLFFIIPIFSVIFFNSTLYGGWRHLYFIFPSFVYLIGVGVENFLEKKIYIKFKRIFYLLIVIFFINNIYNLIKIHPYQNIYFNSLFEKKANKLFEIDYWGLGNKEALKFLLDKQIDSAEIDLREASFSSLGYSKLILENTAKEKLSISGTTNESQTFIFTNYIFDINPKFEQKYSIGNNYNKIFILKRGNIIINEIFKKK